MKFTFKLHRKGEGRERLYKAFINGMTFCEVKTGPGMAVASRPGIIPVVSKRRLHACKSVLRSCLKNDTFYQFAKDLQKRGFLFSVQTAKNTIIIYTKSEGRTRRLKFSFHSGTCTSDMVLKMLEMDIAWSSYNYITVSEFNKIAPNGFKLEKIYE